MIRNFVALTFYPVQDTIKIVALNLQQLFESGDVGFQNLIQPLIELRFQGLANLRQVLALRHRGRAFSTLEQQLDKKVVLRDAFVRPAIALDERVHLAFARRVQISESLHNFFELVVHVVDFVLDVNHCYVYSVDASGYVRGNGALQF